ncbi:hypothetical protein MOQ_007204 [Trypanosoma cruzi marinkellei]|uniref:Uncharacterized protein n=1 Tax=Trypanosoma cruzi marinkellei TaxID=85056 RepID=K2N350_TRYCR|nr:hypothetical protein MOQ_007204 [Trypanosoma cruzi marinkellei]
MEPLLLGVGDGMSDVKKVPAKRRRHRSPKIHEHDYPTHGADEKQGTREVNIPVEEPLLKGPRTEGKTHSNFVELRRSLVDAAAVAAFIQEHHDTKLRDVKQVNNFFQALSNCSDDLFALLCQQHRHQVHLALERMFELYATGKVTILPAAHEFLIRCEQNGVRRMEWTTGLESEVHTMAAAASTNASTTTGTEEMQKQEHQVPLPLLLSPRELLKKLAGIDPRGRLERMIEMCSTLGDIHTCTRRLCKATESEKGLEYAAKCQLISKIASKARRICAMVLLPEPPHFSSDDLATLSSTIDILLSLTQRALATRPSFTSQQPISKLTHFAKWCEGYGLLEKSQIESVAVLEAQATRDLGSQATQLETVMMLKALPSGDEAALKRALDNIWNEKEGHFEPYSADVLSSIAVLAGAHGISDAFRVQVAGRLMKTQQNRLSGSGAHLPRRALRFVNAEYSKEKQESIKRMLAAEEEKKGKAQ